MNFKSLTKENIGSEHICCAMSSKTSEEGVIAKKEWLCSRIDEGLVFRKLDARGKVLIEYIPAESAWLPLSAEGYMIINCFWVSGSFKGHGYAKELLEYCESDARERGMVGVAAIVGKKKKPYLTDKSFMLYRGYQVCDACAPYFELVAKKFVDSAASPRFKDCARKGMGSNVKGIDIFYTAQCPFTVPYVKMLEPVIQSAKYPVRTHRIASKEEAQAHSAPVTTYSVFIDGTFYTNEILSSEKLEKLIESCSK